MSTAEKVLTTNEVEILQTEFKRDLNIDLKKCATLLHHIECHGNHTYYCGWDYERWTRVGWTRSDYIYKTLKYIVHGGNAASLEALAFLKGGDVLL